jgi:hypothetical protein
VADNGDSIGDFAADSEDLATLLPPSLALERAYLGVPLGLEETRAQVLDALAEGVGFLSYTGHGGIDRLAAERLLRSGDGALLNQGERSPVAVGMSCFVNYFIFPGFPSVGEELVLDPDGGVVAFWAAAGLSGHRESVDLGSRFLEQLGDDAPRRLGQLVLRAFQAYDEAGGNPELLETFQLLGDPALVLRLKGLDTPR